MTFGFSRVILHTRALDTDIYAIAATNNFNYNFLFLKQLRCKKLCSVSDRAFAAGLRTPWLWQSPYYYNGCDSISIKITYLSTTNHSCLKNIFLFKFFWQSFCWEKIEKYCSYSWFSLAHAEKSNSTHQ